MTTCRSCGTQLGPRLLSCPACKSLVHADRIKELIARAERASALAMAKTAYEEALSLLPPGSRQHAWVEERLAEVSRRVLTDKSQEAAPRHGHGAWKGAAAAGAAGLLALKFKSVIVLALSKGKLVLLGLTKGKTFFSMLASFAVYWTAWGWPFALGLVLSMYIHEMGHVLAFRRFGIPASPPMFIPGLGAFVRGRFYPKTPGEDARIGLAGPLYGLGAAIAALGAYFVTQKPIWAAIAHGGAWLNLFNLLPIGTLDGGRGTRALTRPHRVAVAVLSGAALVVRRDFIVALIAILSLGHAIAGQAPKEPDWPVLIQWLVLIGGLTAILGAGTWLL